MPALCSQHSIKVAIEQSSILQDILSTSYRQSVDFVKAALDRGHYKLSQIHVRKFRIVRFLNVVELHIIFCEDEICL